MNNWDELKEVVSMLRADAEMSAGCGYEYDHLDKAAAGIEALIEQNRGLLEALKTARDYVYQELEDRKISLAGYPHKWALEEQDLAQVDAAIRKAKGEEA